MEPRSIAHEIREWKERRGAVILAHLYQEDEIQEIADFTGDSLELSRMARDVTAEVIVFCGVLFMAETAKILSPEKTVLLPEPSAGCPLADMVDPEAVGALKRDHPGAPVVCYVNSSAEVKAASEYCCTSANAVPLVERIPEEAIIFVPDANLGAYVASRVPQKTIITSAGFCPTHHRVSLRDVERARAEWPGVRILAHPECRMEVLEKVDFIGSTSQISREVRDSADQRFVIATEKGILWRLRRENPDKEFALLSTELYCENMKKTTLALLLEALKSGDPGIQVPEETARKAKIALDRMLAIL